MVGFTAKYLEIRNCIFNGKFVFYNARVSSLFKFGPLPRTRLAGSRRHRALIFAWALIVFGHKDTLYIFLSTLILQGKTIMTNYFYTTYS